MCSRSSKPNVASLFTPSHRAQLLGGIALAVTCFGPMPSAQALALGELTVTSHIGQYLEAEIELLSLDAGQGEVLIARLADKALYAQFGIPRAEALSDLRFNIDYSNPNNAVVRIQSTRPINEPFLNLLLAIEGPSGTIVREVAILLDPMVFTPQASTATSDQALSSSSPESLESLPMAETLPMEPQLASASVEVPAVREIWVNRGDTLMTLAAAVTPPGVTVQQATVALYRANPSAFAGSIHRMRHSVSLSVPSIESMTAISVREAKAALVMPANVAKTEVKEDNEEKVAIDTAEVEQTPAMADDLPIDENGYDWNDFFDVAIVEQPQAQTNIASEADVNEEQSPADASLESVTEVAVRDPRLLASVLPAEDELIEMRGLIADLKTVLEGLDSSVTEKISQLETMDVRVVELQATFNRLESQVTASASTAASTATAAAVATDTSPTAPVEAAPKLSAALDSNDLPTVMDELPQALPDDELIANPNSVEDIEALAAVLLDPVAIETARENGTLEELVEEAKEAALLEAIDRGAVNQETVVEVIPDELLDNSVSLPAQKSSTEPVSNTATTDDFNRKSPGFSDDVMRVMQAFLGDEADAEKIRRLLLNGGLVIIAGTMFAFLYRRWSWRREVRIMELELDENRPVDTSNTLAYYRSTLDGEELQEEELKEALRKNRAAHDVRLQLLKFYASKHDVAKFSECARDMYRLTRGRVPEWQYVIEMGLKLDPNMQFYDAEPVETVEPSVIQRSEIQEIDKFDTDNGIDAQQEFDQAPKIDENAELEVHFQDESLADYAENHFAADAELDNSDFHNEIFDDTNLSSQRDFTKTIDLVEQYEAAEDGSVDLNLFDDEEDVSVKAVHEELNAEIEDEFDDEFDDESVLDDIQLGAPTPPESLDDVTVVDVTKNDTVFLDTEASNEDGNGSVERVVDEGVQRDMELKLVLARAYIDNRFFGEARTLLVDVLQKGATSQQMQAELLMQELQVKRKNRA